MQAMFVPDPSVGLVNLPNGSLSNQCWMLDDGCTDKNTSLCECWGVKNHLLTPVNDWIHDFIRYWYLGLESEVGSSLEYKYSVTCGFTKAAWYSPCVRWGLVGASTRSMGGKVRWVVGWVCGRMFS